MLEITSARLLPQTMSFKRFKKFSILQKNQSSRERPNTAQRVENEKLFVHCWKYNKHNWENNIITQKYQPEIFSR